MKRLQIMSILGIGLVTTPASYAATVNVGALKDNTIFNESANSNGQGGDFASGVVSDGRIRRGLLQFDLSAIPTTAQIDDVTLRLHLFQVSGGDLSARAFSVHRLTSSWGEGASVPPGGMGGGGGTGGAAQTGDATWNHRFYDTVSWTTAGGDFLAGASDSTTVGLALDFYEWSGAGLITDVQAWVNGSASTFGWLVHSDETAVGGRRFDSLQSSTANFRPLLTVVYTVPEPGSAVLAIMAMMGVRFVSRRRFQRK
jgi:hypothetical protein